MMDLIEAEVTLIHLKAKRDELQQKLKEAQAARDSLPRSDKKGAYELLQTIQSLTAAIIRMRPEIVHHEGLFKRKEQHGIWELAVLNLWGADGLAACRAQMRQEKIKRGHEAPTSQIKKIDSWADYKERCEHGVRWENLCSVCRADAAKGDER